MIPAKLIQGATDFLKIVPPEAYPLLESIVQSGKDIFASRGDKTVALAELQALERKANAMAALALADAIAAKARGK